MIKRYALDPQAVLDTASLKLFVHGLGIDQGRVLAHYPGKWHRKATALLGPDLLENKDLLTAIEYIGTNAPHCVRVDEVVYDGTIPWAENVAKNAGAFTAGLVAEEAVSEDSPPLYPLSTLNRFSTPDYWKVSRSVETPNNYSPTLLRHLKPLLELESAAAFMDPYIIPEKSYEAFVLELLEAFPSLTTILLHSGQVGTTSKEWSQAWQELFDGRIRDGTTIMIFRWRERGDDRPHRRYVVNARGGIGVDRGFPNNRYTNALSLLSAAETIAFWNEFGSDRSGPWEFGRYYLKDAFLFDSAGYKELDELESDA